MKEEGKKLIQSILYILMGLQIVLGIIWFFTNLGVVPYFEESTELIAMSETLCIDEYTGILYPLCIRVLFALGKSFGLPGYSLLYVLQMAAACFAYWYFLKKVVKCVGKRTWFYAGFIMTVPCIAQCHVAVLPYSLVSSVFVVLLADLVDLWRREYQVSRKQMLRVGVLWIVSALLSPDYGLLSGITVGISVLCYVIRNRKMIGQMLVLCLVSVLCIGAVEAVVQKEGAMGKIQKSVPAAMVQRFVWPNFVTFRDFWSEEVNVLWDVGEMAGLAMYPEKVIYEFGPVLEQTYGKERANEIYSEMAMAAFGLDTKNIIFNMAEDMVAYVCPPMTMLLQLKGVGSSYTGWNYARMKDYAPEFTGYYVKYALSAWLMIWLLGIGLWLSVWNVRRKMGETGVNKGVLKGAGIGGFLCTVSMVLNLWYVMCSGNMQDYKKLMVNSVLCSFLVVKIVCVARIDK